jgi:hypothetical protein
MWNEGGLDLKGDVNIPRGRSLKLGNSIIRTNTFNDNLDLFGA